MKTIVRQFENGTSRPLKELGINGKISRVWTILNEEKLFTQFDPRTGEKSKITDLQSVRPRHWESCFLEDKLHDWDVNKDRFVFNSHSSEKGEKVDLLIIWE